MSLVITTPTVAAGQVVAVSWGNDVVADFTSVAALINGTGTAAINTTGTAGGLTGTPNITVGTFIGTTGYFSGNLGVGVASAATALDVAGSELFLGNTNGGSFGVRTNSTAKSGNITSPHYTNAQARVTTVGTYSDSSVNQVLIGGGSGAQTAVTDIYFYTAANNTTAAGTQRLHIDSAGLATFGTGITATSFGSALLAEVNTLSDEIASVSQVSTPATGSCANSFTFKNAAGNTVTGIRHMLMIAVGSTGNPSGATTWTPTLGDIRQGIAGQWGGATTTSGGQFGFTLTAAGGVSPTGDYYVAFILPNGKELISSVIHCN